MPFIVNEAYASENLVIYPNFIILLPTTLYEFF